MVTADGTAERRASGSRGAETLTDGLIGKRADGRRWTGRWHNSRTDEQLQMGPQRDERTDLEAQRDARKAGQEDERTDDETERGGLMVGRTS